MTGAAADDAGGFEFGVVGIFSLPAEAFRPVFGGGRLRYPDTAPIVGGKGKYDPSRGPGGGADRPVAGRGDRAVLPGFAGSAGWRRDVVAGALSAGISRRSIYGRGHNDGRSRTPRHSRPPGKTVDAGDLRRSPSPPFGRKGTTAAPHGDVRSHLQMPLCTLRGAERAPLLSREHGRIRHGAQTGRLGSHRGSLL